MIKVRLNGEGKAKIITYLTEPLRMKVLSGVDETFDDSFAGKHGYVVGLDFNHSVGCEVGNITDPLITLEFSDGIHGEFWREELFAITGSLDELIAKATDGHTT